MSKGETHQVPQISRGDVSSSAKQDADGEEIYGELRLAVQSLAAGAFKFYCNEYRSRVARSDDYCTSPSLETSRLRPCPQQSCERVLLFFP